MSEPEASPQESRYPFIESFIEYASSADIDSLVAPLTAALAQLPGPKAEQGKKAQKGVERTSELFVHLLQVRERLEAERKGAR